MNAAAHSRFAPSAFDRLAFCAAAPSREPLFPEVNNPETSEEGTAAHWVAYVAKAEGRLPAVGELAPNGYAVTEEMRDGATLWAVTLQGLGWVQEQRVLLPSIHPDSFGTPDAWCIDGNGTIRIGDYKFGHAVIDPFENWQVAGGYANGLVDLLGVAHDPAQRIVITIVQPRGYNAHGPVRHWFTNVGELRAMWNKLHGQALRADLPNPQATPGLHCHYCRARRGCPENRTYVMREAEEIVVNEMPRELDPASLGLHLKHVQKIHAMLSAHETGLSEYAEHLVRTGQRVPGFGLEKTQSRLKWSVPVDVVKMTGELIGVDLMGKPEPITPVQAIDKIKKGKKANPDLDEAIIETISTRPPGAMVFRAIDEKHLQRIFSNGN